MLKEACYQRLFVSIVKFTDQLFVFTHRCNEAFKEFIPSRFITVTFSEQNFYILDECNMLSCQVTFFTSSAGFLSSKSSSYITSTEFTSLISLDASITASPTAAGVAGLACHQAGGGKLRCVVLYDKSKQDFAAPHNNL